MKPPPVKDRVFRAVFRMALKAELIATLKAEGIEVPANMSVPELQVLVSRLEKKSEESEFGKLKKDAMNSMSTLKKEFLNRLVSGLQLDIGDCRTKGELLLLVRENLPELTNSKVGFGKHKDLKRSTLIDMFPSYRDWVIREEVRAPECQPALRVLAFLSRVHLTKGFYDWDLDEKTEKQKKFSSKEEGKQSDPEEEHFYQTQKDRVKKWEAKKEQEKTKKEQETVEKAAKTPLPPSEDEGESEDPQKFRRVPTRVLPVRPTVVRMNQESDSSSTSWMELSEKRKHQGQK